MSAELNHTLRSLHACYCENTWQTPPYATCERRLLDFHNAGFSKDELFLVISMVKRLNKNRDEFHKLSLRFGNLVGDLERFGDLLGEVRAEQRAKEHKAKHSYAPAKAEVLRATGRPGAPAIPENCISAQEAIKRLRESV